MIQILTVLLWSSYLCAAFGVVLLGWAVFLFTGTWRFDRKLRDLQRLQMRERARRTVYR
jgi:hypothetical protein